MVVPLLLFATLTKLAIAVAATHRTRLWWTPGVCAMAAGAVELDLLHVSRTVGEGTVVLGTCAVVIARLLRPRVASRA